LLLMPPLTPPLFPYTTLFRSGYWPQQLMNYGDLWFPDGVLVPSEHELGATKGPWVTDPTRYPDFKPLPNFQPQRNRWYCYELMVDRKSTRLNSSHSQISYAVF